jgi:hypothetical protein
MEYNLNKTTVGVLSSALDAVSEQPVDIDFTLPDYCPDIEKILRCKIIPKIYNRNLSGGQLQIDGTTVVNILYTDSKNNVRACEQSLPFNASFSLKEVPDNPIIETDVKCEYLNCRPLSQRRLTIHGAFSLYAKVYTKGELDLYSPPEDSELEFNTEEITVSALSALCQEQFSVGDEVQVVNKPPVELILDSDVRAVISDYKIVSGKILFNGDLNVRLIYINNADPSAVNQLDYSIPFSKSVDCNDLSEDTEAGVKVTLLSYDIRLKNDILSETPIVNIDSRICVSVTGYNSENVTVVLDAYSTDFNTEIEKSRICISELTNVIEDSFMLKDSISVSDCDISEVIDFNVKYDLINSSLNDDKAKLSSKLTVNILAQNSSGEPEYIERAVEFDKEIEVSGFNNIVNVSAEVMSVSYRIADNGTIELRCEIKYSLILENNKAYTIVTSINVDEDNKIKKRNCALVLYYSDENESLWDIAKRYNTKMSLIIDENSLGEDSLTNSKMLLIPMV